MGIYLFVTNLCSDTVRPDREEGETRGCRSEIAAKTVISVKWRLSEMKKKIIGKRALSRYGCNNDAGGIGG